MAVAYPLYILSSLFAAGVSLILAVFALSQRQRDGARALGWLMLGVSGWCLLSGLGLLSPDETTAGLAVRTAYFFTATVPVLWIRFTCEYVKRQFQPDRLLLHLLWVAPLISLTLAWTNDWHRLFWRQLDFSWTGGFLTWDATFGPGFWFHAIYGYGLILSGAFLIFRYAIPSFTLYRLQTIALLTGCLAPILASLPAVFGLSELTLTPFGLVVSGISLLWAAVRTGLLDLRPIGRDLLIEQMQDGMIIVDEQGRVVDINPAARGLLGYDEKEILGAAGDEVLRRLTGRDLHLNELNRLKFEIVRTCEGEKFYYSLSISPLYGSREEVIGRLIHLQDVTERVVLYQEVEVLANTDSLTGLVNRRRFFDLAQEFARRQGARKTPCAVILIDIDHFKLVNDRYGHLVGDQILPLVATRLMRQVRLGDIVARYGGEEFVIFLPNTCQAEAERVANRLCRAVAAEPFSLDTISVGLSISIGLVTTGVDGSLQLDDTIQQADEALYAAKRAGRNRVKVFAE